MDQVELDERGRITIPKDIRQNIKHQKFIIIQAGDHIKLIPIPPDPFKTLEGALNIPTPFKTLREKATQQLEEETKRATP